MILKKGYLYFDTEEILKKICKKPFTFKKLNNNLIMRREVGNGFKGRQLDRVLTFFKKGYISRRKLNKVTYEYKLTNKYISLYSKIKSISSSPTYL